MSGSGFNSADGRWRKSRLGKVLKSNGRELVQGAFWTHGAGFTEIVLDEKGSIVAFSQADTEQKAWEEVQSELRRKGIIT